MPELIERGHVYIAQPPLYKVKKGKQETYLKDDAELNAYLMRTALDGASLMVSADSPPISGPALEDLSSKMVTVNSIIQRLAKRYDEQLLRGLLYMSRVDESLLGQQDAWQAWLEELESRMNVDARISDRYRLVAMPADEPRDGQLRVEHVTHGITNAREMPYDFFLGNDYLKIAEMAEHLDGLLADDAVVQRGEKQQPVATFEAALRWLMDEAKRGQHIQRYKGLGEMNPDQLWETTMDPDTRRLLRVNIEDVVGSDQIFTTLMGDQVEPRREFIERNALTVENLDV
jgi:DNA gyrase subunit B